MAALQKAAQEAFAAGGAALPGMPREADVRYQDLPDGGVASARRAAGRREQAGRAPVNVEAAALALIFAAGLTLALAVLMRDDEGGRYR